MTEAATNILRHGGGGEIVLDARSYDHSGEVNILALDGPGMANVQDCLRDGVSTADSAGTGLGAIQRQSDHFDIYSAGPGHRHRLRRPHHGISTASRLSRPGSGRRVPSAHRRGRKRRWLGCA